MVGIWAHRQKSLKDYLFKNGQKGSLAAAHIGVQMRSSAGKAQGAVLRSERKRRIVGARTLVIYTQALVMNEMSVHPRVSFVSVSVIKSVHKFSLQLGLVWSNPNSRGA